HVTEELFLGSPWAYSVRSVASSARPSREGVRRNAVWRLLGWDLPSTDEDGKASYVRPQAANVDFTVLFEALLAEVMAGLHQRDELLRPERVGRRGDQHINPTDHRDAHGAPVRQRAESRGVRCGRVLRLDVLDDRI